MRNLIYLFLIDPSKLIIYNKNYADYEKEEPGYSLNLLKAYKKAWNTPINRKINHELLRSIHKEVLGHDLKREAGQYKNSSNFFELLANLDGSGKMNRARPNTSLKGLSEFIETWMGDTGSKIHELKFRFLSKSIEYLVQHSFVLTRSKGKLVISSLHEDDDLREFMLGENKIEDYCPDQDFTRIKSAMEKTINPYTREDINNQRIVICTVDSMPDNLINPYNLSEKNIELLDNIFDSYNTAIIHAETPEEKLKIIVKHVQRISQLHSFLDGNIRTCYILLNRLLKEEGLSLTLLLDPNRFDCFSVEELVNFVKEGQIYLQDVFSEKIPSFNSDFFIAAFIKENPSKNIQSLLIHENGTVEFEFFLNILLQEKNRFNLAKKYSLNDYTLTALERGLRNAAANNKVDDIKSILALSQLNIDAQDSNPTSKKTALHLATERENTDVICYLLEKGANPKIAVANGLTALEVANKNPKISALFDIRNGTEDHSNEDATLYGSKLI